MSGRDGNVGWNGGEDDGGWKNWILRNVQGGEVEGEMFKVGSRMGDVWYERGYEYQMCFGVEMVWRTLESHLVASSSKAEFNIRSVILYYVLLLHV